LEHYPSGPLFLIVFTEAGQAYPHHPVFPL